MLIGGNLNKSKQIEAKVMGRLRPASCIRSRSHCVLASATSNPLQVFVIGFLSALSTFTSALGADEQRFEAEAAKFIGGASKVADGSASGNNTVALNAPGDGIEFTDLPAASKIAIRYASTTVGTISVTVNDQPARKVKVHSSGALTNSFLNAIVKLTVPAKPVRRWTCLYPDRACRNRQSVRSPGCLQANTRLTLFIAAPDRWPWMP
jgi:hypothetical protein